MPQSLTVVMPVYNGMPFLSDAVESLLQQTYQDFQILIIDDGSTDGSWTYLESLVNPQIQIRRQENLGLPETLNRAVESVQSEFVAFLDQDDIALPTRLQEQIQFLVNHPDYDCVLCIVSKITADGKDFGYYKLKSLESIIDYKPQLGCINRSAMCIRKQAFSAIGGYHASAYPVDDYELLLRLWENYKVAIINEPLVGYRVHSNSLTFRVFHEVQLKTRYVETMSQYRKSGKLEVSFQEFVETFNQTDPISKLSRFFQGYGMLLFRKAGILFGEGRIFFGISTLIGAFLLHPQFVANRLLSRRIHSVST